MQFLQKKQFFPHGDTTGSGGGAKCPPPAGEILWNYDFNCGVKKWGFDPNYPAIITDNGDGSLHLKSTSNFGSLVPEIALQPISTYILKIKVINISGNGKMSIRNSNNAWFNSPNYTTPGEYSFTYHGNIKEIHVGADSDDTFEADFDFISLKKIDDEWVLYNGDQVTYAGDPVFYL